MQDTTSLPAIDSLVRIVKVRYASMEQYNGKNGTVIRSYPDLNCILTLTDGVEVAVDEWEPVSTDDKTEPINRYTPPPSYEVLRESHAELERKVALLERKVETLSTQVENGHKAIEQIGHAFMDEADKRGWCAEADAFIDRVNETLPGSYEMPTRMHDYEVEWTEIVQVQVSRSVTIRARNEDEARDMAPNEVDCIHIQDVVDSVRYGAWEVDEYADPEYYVTEV